MLAEYTDRFYAGYPALTENRFGAGKCYYIAAHTSLDFLQDFYRFAAAQAGVSPVLSPLPSGVLATERVGDQGRFLFVMNTSPARAPVTLPACENLRTGEAVSGPTVLKGYEVLVLKR